MALKDQPYLPLYVQDVLTDEKLIECSPEAHGIYFRLLCLLHKQDKYGLICMKQKYKQTDNKIENFACMLAKQMPFEQKQITKGLEELYCEGVVSITEEQLFQKRMLHDGEISLLRSRIGKTGGSSVTKQYGKSGFLYLMSDRFDLHKIGISVNPLNRLYRLRSDLKLPKHFDIIDKIEVADMGSAEDIAHEFCSGYMDGEWVKDSFSNICDKFALLQANIKAKDKAKDKANTEYEYENENECKIDIINVPFDVFWDLYDKKRGERQKLEKKWNGLTNKERSEIMEYIPRYKEATPDKKFRKDPQTFLNNKSWNDEIILPCLTNDRVQGDSSF